MEFIRFATLIGFELQFTLILVYPPKSSSDLDSVPRWPVIRDSTVLKSKLGSKESLLFRSSRRRVIIGVGLFILVYLLRRYTKNLHDNGFLQEYIMFMLRCEEKARLCLLLQPS